MYVTPRAGTRNLYARIIVPDDLRSALGRDEIWRSLKTADKREAQKRGAPIFAEWLSTFDALRVTRPATDADNQAAAFESYSNRLQLDQHVRSVLPAVAELAATCTPEQIREYMNDPDVPDREKQHVKLILEQGPLAFLSAAHAAGKKKLAMNSAMGDIASARRHAQEVIRRSKLNVIEGSPAFFALCNAIQRGELEAFKRALERNEGEWGGAPTDLLVKPLAVSQKALPAKPGETITELFEAFYRERAGAATKDTWDQNRMVVRLFADYVGRQAHVTAISRKAISGWKKQLMLWPRKAGDMKEFAGLDFKSIIAKNAMIKKPPISDKTINRYLSGLGKFCLWLLANDHLDVDVMRGQYLALDKSKKKILPYDDQQLVVIFSSPIFTGCGSDVKEHLPGDHSINDWRRWVPLLALYSGARLGEICQLMTADVRQIGEIWVMHVTTEGDGDKRVKTAGSQRVVPLHPALMKRGFLDFHSACAKAKQSRLFPELKRDTRGQFGEPSRFFNRYFARIGVKADNTQNFHSFRHGIADAFRLAGYRDEEFAPLLGHVKGTTTARYSNLREGELTALKKMIDAVNYPGL